MNTIKPCIITKTAVEKPKYAFRHVAVRTDIYDAVSEVAKDTGRSVRYVTSKLLNYALANLEITEADD